MKKFINYCAGVALISGWIVTTEKVYELVKGLLKKKQ